MNFKEKLSDIVYDVKHFFKDLKWKVKHRTTHKYNYLDTGLKPGYYDPDMQIKHAVLKSVVDFVDFHHKNDLVHETNPYNGTDPDGNNHFIVFQKLENIKKEWLTIQQELYHDLWSAPFEHEPGVKGIERLNNPEYSAYLKKLSEREDFLEKRIQELLHEVINVLPYLWYP